MARMANAIDTLFDECNEHAPNRSTASDGWLGDPAHAARASDHNPNSAGVVRAADITDDAAHGLDGSDLFHRLHHLMGKHPALKSGAYLIHNRKIVSFDRLSEGLRDYDGANAHLKHVHVSVSTAAAGYDSRLPLNIWDEDKKPDVPAAKPVPQSTVTDIAVALKRFAERSENPNAKQRMLDAVASLDDIADGKRVKLPTSVASAKNLLRKRLELKLTDEQRDRIESALDLLRPL